jgi:SPP1 family predicted phage head-tail adaptor
MATAGQRNQRVTIQALPDPPTSDDQGQPTSAWADVATVWAQALPPRGREYAAAGGVQSEAPVIFRIHYRAGLTSAMRVVWRGKPYAIVADPIDLNGGRHTIELVCASKAAA